MPLPQSIAAIDELRWSIELFFRFLKQVLGLKRLFSDKPEAVAIQVYCAVIASLLMAYASANDFTIVSKDADFQQRALSLGHPPKVIWILLGNCPTSTVASLLRAKHADILAFEADPTASLLALS